MFEHLFSISFERPQWLWLLLTIPPMLILSWRALNALETVQRVVVLTTRSLVVLLVVLCIAGIEYIRKNDDLTVMFLLDRSNSIPKDKYAAQEQYIYEVAKQAPPDDKVGVISFDGQSYVEQLPMRGGVFIDVIPDTSLPDRTDVSGAIRMAMALFPHDTARRIVLVTDGNNNVGDLLGEVETAVANGVGIDVLPMHYLHNQEVFVEKLVAPGSVKDGDLVPLRAIVNARRPASGTISLLHNGVPVDLPEDISRVRLDAGQNLVGLKVPVHGNKPHRFQLAFTPDNEGSDTLVENNRATAFTFVGDAEKVLFLTKDDIDDAELVRALRKEKLNVDVVNVADAEILDLLGYMQYSTVILANVAANWFTDSQQQDLATYVKEMGGGLIMLGGDESFGAGGWIGSPIEDVIPVDFEIKHRQVIPRGALVVVMHSCEMPRGNYWGKRVAKKAVDTISSKDYFGMLGYSHFQGVIWEVPMQVAVNKSAIKHAIDKMQNGDMPDFASTMELAVDQLMELQDAAQRHVIIISDGDAQAPLPATLKRMSDNKITCSTIGIGYGQHVMEPTLRNIAKKTGGRFYAARNPKMLPQIFVKESKVVRRPLISEKTFVPQLNYAMSDLWAGMGMEAAIPPLHGLVMTSPKQDAFVEMPLVRKTSDGEDPVLAHWQIGLGKTVAFTSGYWTHWGEDWTQWAAFSKLWAQIVRWTMGQGKRANFDVATKLEGSQGRIIVNALDNNSEFMNYLNLSASVAKPSGRGIERVKLQQVGPGRYEGEFTVDQTGQYVANIAMLDNGQMNSITHTGLAVPYSPEYKELRANEALLQKIVDVSGGQQLTLDTQDAAVFRHDLPPTESHQPAWEGVLSWLLLPLFLFDVALRRLASMVALSVFIEVILGVVLLFGAGVVNLDGWQAVWGIIGVLLLGEIVGWSIRHRSIMPTIEFFTGTVTTLGRTTEGSARSLDQLKGTRERVQEDRTTEGLGRKLDRVAQVADAAGDQRFDVGESVAKEQAGDIREALDGAAQGQDKPGIPWKPVRAQEHSTESPADALSRLKAARKRARSQMDDEDDQSAGSDS